MLRKPRIAAPTDYLDDNELVGCCAGSICRANARGVPVCQAASETELASAQE